MEAKMVDELLDQIEEVEVRHGATLDFLGRLAGLLCKKGIIEQTEVNDLLDGLKPPTNSERSGKDQRRTMCYVSTLDRIRRAS